MAEFDSTNITITEMLGKIEHVYLPTGKAAIFFGAPGAAKTSTAIALALRLQRERADFGACYMNMSSAITPDVMGAYKNTPGPLTQYGVPLLFQPNRKFGLRGAFPVLNDPECDPWSPGFNWRALTPYSEGIAYIDESTKVFEEGVQAKLAEFYCDGVTGQWGVPEGWTKIGFANRAEDMSNDTPIAMHTANRLGKYNVYTAFEDVAPYWKSRGMHEDFVGFASANAGLVFSPKVPLSQEQFGTARSFMDAWLLCMAYSCNVVGIPDMNEEARKEHVAKGGNGRDIPIVPEFLPVGDDTSDAEVAEVVRGFITILAAHCGEGVALAFKDYLLHRHEKPTIDQIKSNPTTAPLSQHPGILHATMEMIIDHLPFEHHEKAFTYAQRMNKALCAVFCSKFASRYGVRAATLPSFHKLVAYCGASARVMIYSK